MLEVVHPLDRAHVEEVMGEADDPSNREFFTQLKAEFFPAPGGA